MKRFYPELNDATQSFFVNASDISPREVDGVLTAPLLFDQSIPLKGSNPTPYALDHSVLLNNIYLRVPGHGIVAVDVSKSVNVAGQVRKEKPHIAFLTGRGKFPLSGIEDASVTLSFVGTVALFRSIADFEVHVLAFEGLQEEPTPVGYDLELYEAFTILST
jgi:hypothetical protein